MNRGNRRAEVFHSDNDYAAFLALLRRSREPAEEQPVPSLFPKEF
jgi:hypothetical protein